MFLELTDDELAVKLRSGSVGILPTDTVYGLVCIASEKDAVSRLYETKRREVRPGTVITSSLQQLIDLGIAEKEIQKNEEYLKKGASVVIQINESLKPLSLSKEGLACRLVSAPAELVSLLNKTGPLLTTSANMPGEPTANTLQEAQGYFGDSVDFYVDGGDLSDRESSTVAELVDGELIIHRQGSIDLDHSLSD